MLPLLLTLQVAVAQSAHVDTLADPVAVVQRLHRDAAEFLAVWRFYWEQSEAIRHDVNGDAFGRHLRRPGRVPPRYPQLRLTYLHCHPDGLGNYSVRPTMIREGAATLRAVCPSWPLDDSVIIDERLSIDAALDPRLVSGVRLARAELIASLERAGQDHPSEQWIA